MNKVQTIRLVSILFLFVAFTSANAQINSLKNEPIHEKEKVNINVLESDVSPIPDSYLILIPNPIPCELSYEMEIVIPESGCDEGAVNRAVLVTFSGTSANTEYGMNAQGGAVIIQKGMGIYQVVGNGVWSITASQPTGTARIAQPTNCSVTAESNEIPYMSNTGSTQETGMAQNDGTATAGVTGGTAPYTIVWSNGIQGTINASGESHTISGLSAGQYEAVITDSDGIVSKACIHVSRKRSGRGRGGKTGDTIPANSLTAQPNPFAHNTVISFTLPEDAFATLSVYSINGKLMHTAYQGETEAGQNYQVEINANDWISGTYIIQLTTDYGLTSYQRLMVTK